tara:strand:- start:2603 stop:3157 length:555 start_codon:yes stop_codon:yes gene_type:complete
MHWYEIHVMEQIKLNRSYNLDTTYVINFFDYTDIHGLIDSWIVRNSIFMNGTVAAGVMEPFLCCYFKNLKWIKGGNDYDMIAEDSQERYKTLEKLLDHKGFTVATGGQFSRSKYQGTQRTQASPEQLAKDSSEKIFVFTSYTSFPKIEIVFRKGSDLLKEFPNGKISHAQHDKLFCGERIYHTR